MPTEASRALPPSARSATAADRLDAPSRHARLQSPGRSQSVARHRPATVAAVRGFAVALCASVVILVAAGCGGDDLTEVVVFVHTDLSVPLELDSVEISVDGPDGSNGLFAVDFTVAGTPRWPLGLSLVAKPGAYGPLVVTATGRKGGSVLVSQRIRTGFVAGQRRMAELFLLRECFGQLCDDQLTCRAGSCQSDAIAAADLPAFHDEEPAFDAGVPDGGRATFGSPEQITGGGNHACLRDDAQQVFCWGANDDGQLGTGGTGGNLRIAQRVGMVGPVMAVGAGVFHSCAIAASDGQVVCWGNGDHGRLGNGSTSRSPIPVATGLTGAVSVSAGSGHTCAVSAEQVHCWGDNAHGQAGNGSAGGSVMAPAAVAAGVAMPAALVSAGGSHSCALGAGGLAFCWGANDRGQLGDGTTEERTVPTAVTGERGYTAIATGGEHTCAIGTDTNVYCWGTNTAGQIGQPLQAAPGGVALSSSPMLVTLPEPARSVTAGNAHSCAATTGGSVYCWGSNDACRLGVDNGGQSISSPTIVDQEAGVPLRNVVEVNGGTAFTCARNHTGIVRCWGSNRLGQLGDNTSVDQRCAPNPLFVP